MVWLVIKDGQFTAAARYELPIFEVVFDEQEARQMAKKREAVLASLPIIEDYRKPRPR